jgi:DNA-directed RNA polymerase alpha subunit
MTDRIHVYCEIDPDAPMRICQPLIDEAIKKQEERQAGIEAKDLTMNIYDVDLSARSAVALKRVGFEKVGDLKGKKRTDLIKIRNLGRKSADEVWALMQKFGIAEDEDGQTV